MKHLFLVAFLCLFGYLSYSQDFIYAGKVLDARSGEVLPFVNLIYGGKSNGVISDINGNFVIKSARKLDSIQCSFVGYESMVYSLVSSRNNSALRINLNPKTYQLKEFVVLPTENPAHRIIHQAVQNRDKNNPMKNSSFSYYSYNKMVFTSEVLQDTTAIRIAQDTSLQDTISVKIRNAVNFFNSQHLFMMESVSKRIFKAPDKNFEKIIASKVSGFKDPIFSLLITQVQAISFYDDLFLLLDKKYVNPISKGSTSRYFFEIQDTIYQNHDSVFVISYRPLKGSVFDGLKGVVYINTNAYAIQNVIAEPAKKSGGFNISIQQQYDLVNGEKWFPSQLNTNFYFNAIQTDGYKVIGKGTSYIQDIQLNEGVKNRDFGNIDIDLDIDSPDKSDQILVEYRRFPLSDMEMKTYSVIDSLSKKHDFEKYLNRAKTWMTGKIPFYLFDIDVTNLIRFNVYEGWRPEIGLYTGKSFSKWITLGGYAAYGFADQFLKYKLEAVWNINKTLNTTLSVAYKDDISESAISGMFYDSKTFFDGDYMRRSFVNRFNRAEKFEIAATHRFFNYLTSRLELNVQTKTPMFQVEHLALSEEDEQLFQNKKHLAEAVLSFRYAYGEKFIKNGDWVFSMGTDYPVFTTHFVHGFYNVLNSEIEYNKLLAKVSKSFQFKYWGKLFVQMDAGISDRKLPLWGNFVAKSCFNDAYLYCDNSFQSIKINSFVSDRYFALFLKHNFGKSKFFYKQFKPELSILLNVLYGDLNHNQYLEKYHYQTPKNGYFESGILINKIIDLKTISLGAGTFYNFGYYASPITKDNFTFLWSFSLPIE